MNNSTTISLKSMPKSYRKPGTAMRLRVPVETRQEVLSKAFSSVNSYINFINEIRTFHYTNGFSDKA